MLRDFIVESDFAFSTSIITAVAVNVFAMDSVWKSDCGVTGTFNSTLARPYPAALTILPSRITAKPTPVSFCSHICARTISSIFTDRVSPSEDCANTGTANTARKQMSVTILEVCMDSALLRNEYGQPSTITSL
jgi:hypothetical protein